MGPRSKPSFATSVQINVSFIPLDTLVPYKGNQSSDRKSFPMPPTAIFRLLHPQPMDDPRSSVLRIILEIKAGFFTAILPAVT